MNTTQTKEYRAMAAKLQGKSLDQVQALYDENSRKANEAKSPSTAQKYMHRYFACEDALKGRLGCWA